MIFVLSGGTKLFAAIGVTYPEGSTLTCTDGTKTLKAKTTTGQWVFSIPYAGTWTVTATDGTNTKSESVEITAEGQFESVVLSYRKYIFSYESGFAEGFSGWQHGYAGGTTRNKAATATDTGFGYILELDGWSSNFAFKVVEPIAISGYSSVNIRVLMDSDATTGVMLGVDDVTYQGYGVSAFQTNSIAYATLPDTDISDESILSLPIGDISTIDEAYIGIKNVTSGEGFTIYDIYLE